MAAPYRWKMGIRIKFKLMVVINWTRLILAIRSDRPLEYNNLAVKEVWVKKMAKAIHRI
jgi:hypothetical protein